MIIVGEKINASREPIAKALARRDAAPIIDVAVRQAAAGADYIDVNGGDPRPGQEARNIEWLVNLVQKHTGCPVSVDSADPEAVDVGLSLAEARAGRRPILNSISLQSDHLASLLPMLGKYDCMVVGLLMSDAGPPGGVDDRVERAGQMLRHLASAGVQRDRIILDPCFVPIAVEPAAGRHVIDAIAALRARWPDVHVGGGCSNVSYGLPDRQRVNSALLCQAVYAGMDFGIIDPTAPGLVTTILAAEAVAGRDEFCMNYLSGVRADRNARL